MADNVSNHSRHSSHHTRSSTGSSTAAVAAIAQAKAEAAKERLAFIDMEQNYKMKLEKLQLKREVAVAEAEASVLKRAADEEYGRSVKAAAGNVCLRFIDMEQDLKMKLEKLQLEREVAVAVAEARVWKKAADEEYERSVKLFGSGNI